MYQHKCQSAITSSLHSADLGCQSEYVRSFPQIFQEYPDIIFQQDKRCMYKRSIEARSRYHCHRGKAIIITYSEYVSLALIILHAMRMCSILLLSVACMGLPDVCILFHKR